MNNLIRAITSDGSILCSAINSTNIVSKAENIHRSSAVVTATMGRVLTATSLIGANLKNIGDSVTIRINGGGPIGTITAVSDHLGNPRITVTNPIVEIPLKNNGKLDVGGAVGVNGHIAVIRDLGQNFEPQTAYCSLVTGEIGDDIAAFFAESEQIPTVCGLGVLVNPDLTVNSAGGYLIQLLPGADDETINKVENNLKNILPVSTLISNGLTPIQILNEVLKGFELEIIDELECKYKCNCNINRIKKALISLGKVEINKLIEEQNITEVQCHFCNKVYKFDKEKLRNLIDKSKK